MRFEKLVLRRFGHFTDFELDLGTLKPGEPDLHVLYGPNEAGKSTTLAAISDLLYGIATRTPWNFQHANDMLELEAVLQQGAQKRCVKRFKNYWADATNNRLERFPLDLQGLSREDYVRRFSFDEQTLQDGGEQILNSNGDVGQALFSASAGLANLKELMDKALTDANAFWIPRRTRNIRITELKKALQDNKQRTDAVKLDVRAWKKRCEALEHATLRRDKHRKDRDELQDTLRKLDLQKASGAIALQYTRLTRECQELDVLGVIAVNHTTALDVSTAKACKQAIEQVRGKLEQNRLTLSAQTAQNAQLAQLQEQLLTLTPTAPVLLLMQAAERIHRLAEESFSDDDWQQQREELQSTLTQCDSDLAAASLRLGLSDDASLEQVLPGEAVRSDMNKLLEEEQTLSARLLHAQEELDLLHEHPEAGEDADDDEIIPDTSIASDVLRRVQQDGLAKQLLQARAALLDSRRTVLVNAERLGINSEQISTLDLPESAWLNTHLNELSDLRSLAVQLAERISTQRQDMVKKQKACETLTRAGAVDPVVIDEARMARDAAWQLHSMAVDEEQTPAALQTSARQFEKQLHRHDDLLARAAMDSQAGAKLQLLHSQLQQQQETLDELCQVQQVELAQRIDTCSDLIRRRVASFDDSDDIDLDALRQRHTLILALQEAHIECESQALAIEALQQRCAEQSSKLMAILAPLQTPTQLVTLAHLDLEDLVAQVEKTLAHCNERMLQQRDKHQARQTYLSELARRTETRDATLQAIKSWHERWQASAQGTLFASLSLPQARDTLTWIASVQPQLSNRHETARKLEALNTRMLTRDTAIQNLLKELKLHSLQEAVSGLKQATQQTQDHARVQKDIQALETTIAENGAAHAQNLESIKSLRHALEVDTDEALLELLSRTEQHRLLSDRCTETLKQLQDVTDTASLDDNDIAKLCDEEAMGADVLTQQLQTMKSQLAEANGTYDEANQAWALAKSAVEKIDTDSEYARLVQERTTLLLEIADLARQTATARTGQLVLKAAMARFRQEHQSVILTAAQQAFTTLTGGHYVQLVPRDDGRGNERLFVLDEQGNSRSVSELSTGTRYQLYLALRAAAHADYATQRQPLPFVADDVMESFDDQRSAAAFTVLGKMAEKGQVLYLTHHQHLLDIVCEVMGRDRVTVHRFQ